MYEFTYEVDELELVSPNCTFSMKNGCCLPKKGTTALPVVSVSVVYDVAFFFSGADANTWSFSIAFIAVNDLMYSNKFSLVSK